MGIIKLFTANRFLLYDRIIRAKTKGYVATSHLSRWALKGIVLLMGLLLVEYELFFLFLNLSPVCPM